jgi:hypothetical protein
MSVTQGGYQGITIYNGTTEFVSTRGIRDVSVSIEPEYVDLANGLRRPIAYRRTVSLTIVDHSVYDQLVTWAEALTAVQFVLVGQSKCLQGYDDTYINLVDQFTPFGDVNGFRIELVNTKYSPTWYTNTNLLWYKTWLDGDTDGDADSYTITETVSNFTKTFGTATVGGTDYPNTQSFQVQAAAETNALVQMETDIVCPFPGATATLSTEFVELIDPSAGSGTHQHQISILSIDSSNSVISGGSATTTFTSTGRQSVSVTLPADTYEIRCIIFKLATINGSFTDDVRFRYPTLRVDGISAETLY